MAKFGPNCIACGKPRDIVSTRAFCGMCRKCGTTHAAEGIAACGKVSHAVATGRLARARTLTCVDCGNPATEWEHRDYTKPLDVVPVCRPCNHKRPPAFNSVYRPTRQHLPQPQHSRIEAADPSPRA